MKITKQYLKQIIKEELQLQLEEQKPLQEANELTNLFLASALGAFCGLGGCATTASEQGNGIVVTSNQNKAKSIEIVSEGGGYKIIVSGGGSAFEAREAAIEYLYSTFKVTGNLTVSQPKLEKVTGKTIFTVKNIKLEKKR